jgi:hypothetical protein
MQFTVDTPGSMVLHRVVMAETGPFYMLAAPEKIKTRIPAPETILLRQVMLREGFTVRVLAGECQVSADTLSAQLCDDIPSLRLRCKIEFAFSFKHAIWESPVRLRARERCFQSFKCDPAVLPDLGELKRFAVRIGADTQGCKTRADLEEAILAKAAASSLPSKTTHES